MQFIPVVDYKKILKDEILTQQFIQSEKARGNSDIQLQTNLSFQKQINDLEFELNSVNKTLNEINETIKQIYLDKESQKDVKLILQQKNQLQQQKEELIKKQNQIYAQFQSCQGLVGNLIDLKDPEIVDSKDEELNQIVYSYDEFQVEFIKKNKEKFSLDHFTILQKLGCDFHAGSAISGHKQYFLRGKIFKLYKALQDYALDFLEKQDYEQIYTPFYMKQSIMEKTCQLSDFQETLYKLDYDNSENEKNDKKDNLVLIATSEQPISAIYMNSTIQNIDNPIQFCGFSSCFRKECGNFGKDIKGIFRCHQFEKIEQFVICKPEVSDKMHAKMKTVSENFYKSLNVPFRVVSIVSGALNNAAKKKYDLESYFPSYECYRELCSISNCTDYQSRPLNIKYQKNSENREFVHMLNGTLCAVQRTLCCIVELNQETTGIRVPQVLQKYYGQDFIKF